MVVRTCLALMLVLTLAAAECENLLPDAPCILPFPSDYFRGTDGKLNFSDDAFPFDRNGKPIDATEWNTLDGFAPLMPLMSAFDGLTNESGLAAAPRHWNVARSLEEDSEIVLIDTETAERLACWVELDHWSDDRSGGNGGESSRAVLVWPASALRYGRRYTVALRGLIDDDGVPLEPSEAFRALRDGDAASDPTVEARRDVFEASVFAPLRAAGVERSELLLAWHWTVASAESTRGPLEAAHEEALAIVENGGASFQITSIEEDYSKFIARKVLGTFEVPLFLNKRLPGLDVRLNRNTTTGMPTSGGRFGTFEFEALIPRRAAEEGGAAVLQIGHGLFGSYSQLEARHFQELANANNYVLLACDWVGMSSTDAVTAALMLLTDLSNFAMIPDRTVQGIVNHLVLMRLAGGYMASHPAFASANGDPVISPDPAERYYFGNSQGGIFGQVYMALSTDVTKGVLGVPGAPYSMLLPRSSDFTELGAILKVRYRASRVELISLMSILQLQWARAEPSGFLDLGSSQRVLLHYSLGDAQVSWLGALTMARSLKGGAVFESNVNEGREDSTFGLKVLRDDDIETSASVVVGFDYGVPAAPELNVPPNSDTDTHSYARKDEAAVEMIARFFATGEIVNTCNGACVRDPPSRVGGGDDDDDNVGLHQSTTECTRGWLSACVDRCDDPSVSTTDGGFEGCTNGCITTCCAKMSGNPAMDVCVSRGVLSDDAE